MEHQTQPTIYSDMPRSTTGSEVDADSSIEGVNSKHSPVNNYTNPGADGSGNGSTLRVPVHVEVCQKANSTLAKDSIKQAVFAFLQDPDAVFMNGHILNFQDGNEFLDRHVHSIQVSDIDYEQFREGIPVWKADIRLHVYRLSVDGASEEYTDESEESVSSCSQWVLPAKEFDGLWENLIYDIDIKQSLVQYCSTALLFSDQSVNTNIISWNRVVLLHGPPGTGKTSLCKALAHKISIRLCDRYPNALLLEINAHSLFSKWFSESGKLVMKLFQHINDLVDDEEALVCVLIDEVESLTAARTGAMSGSEPSDAIRVVNALLTQVDQLKERENVLILTTSNISEAIDLAFVDRADIKQYIGLPNAQARYDILVSCVNELSRVGIISGKQFLRTSSKHIFSPNKVEALLMQVATVAVGLSGRSLRKIPFQAHAFFCGGARCVELQTYLKALMMAVEKELKSRKELAKVADTSSSGGLQAGGAKK